MKTSIEQKRDIIRKLLERPDGPPPTMKVAIVSTPRCGSTYFCDLLAKTGLFGMPEEWINPRMIKAYLEVLERKKTPFKEYFDFIMRKTTSANGVFSINFHVDQYRILKKKHIDIFTNNFDVVVYLYRRDKLGQAVSYAKALMTDQWNTTQKPKKDINEVEVKISNIIDALYKLAKDVEVYRKDLEPLVHKSLCYEDYSRNESLVFELLNELGVEYEHEQSEGSDLRVQRDLLNKKLREKTLLFLSESDH